MAIRTLAAAGPVLLLAIALASPCAAGNGDPIDGHPTYRERAMLALVNACRQDPVAYRTTYLDDRSILQPRNYPPVAPLYASLRLGRSARAHSRDMARTPCFQHDSCDGTDLWTRIRRYESGATSLGENIAMGLPTPLEAINALLLDGGAPDHSSGDGHRRNIMAAKFRELGHGSVYDAQLRGWYDTQDFGNGAPAYATPLVSGSHVIDRGGTVTFLASVHDRSGRAPERVTLVIEGEARPLQLAFGTRANGTYRAVLREGDACRAYRFRMEDAAGRAWSYPEDGALYTTGEGGCTREYSPSSLSAERSLD